MPNTVATFANRLTEILGFGPESKITSINIGVSVKHLRPFVAVEMLTSEVQDKQLLSLLKEYELVEKIEEADESPEKSS